MEIDELGREWMLNKFLEICIISLFLIVYRCKYRPEFRVLLFLEHPAIVLFFSKILPDFHHAVTFYVFCMYFVKDNRNCSLYTSDNRSKQFFCDLVDCTIFLILNSIGMLAVLNTNYSFICMLIYCPISMNISIYELFYLFKLISMTHNRYSVIYGLFSFYYGINLLTSSIVSAILLQDYFNEYENIINL